MYKFAKLWDIINVVRSGSGTAPATGGMFGSAAAKPAEGGGLFGAAKTSAPATGGLFGSAPASTASGGLFGSTTPAAPATGGLFGSTSAAPASGGLFGSSTATSQPSGGLFGSTTATSQPAPGGLFGSSTATSQPAQPAGGLFGSSAATSQPQTGGLFGAAAPSQPQTNSLFGASQPAQTQAGGGGLFGQSQAKPAGSMFGGLNNTQNQQSQPQNSLFGSTNQTQQQGTGMLGSTLNQNQTVPGVRIDISNLRTTTRFNDLHEDLQNQIKAADEQIQKQMALKSQCDSIMPSHGEQLAGVAPDVDFCRRKMNGVQDALESDAEAIVMVRNLIKSDAEAAKLSFRVVDNLKLPPQYHNTGIWSGKSTSNDSRGQTNGEAQDLVGFFSKTADELRATLERYEKNISEIEMHLRGVEAYSAQQVTAMVARKNGSSGGDENPIQELADTLTAFEESILGVAGKVGETRVGVQTLQRGEFVSTGSMRGNGKRRGVY
ncbi:hypothetical protein BP5796_05236 [Coleophoma crateriformis]|uniref:Nucleoporin NUP49/NSP49 n=1 Tax=Coleophoma crateriformis TaxID=565419 RepID=A0A3D8S2P5_9HELO|nr:hypothetical protein BP5796_05236 [Coleophoma crateriformis]